MGQPDAMPNAEVVMKSDFDDPKTEPEQFYWTEPSIWKLIGGDALDAFKAEWLLDKVETEHWRGLWW